MRAMLLVALFLPFAGRLGWAEQVDWDIGTPVEIYEVQRMPKSPVLDGRLTDAAWEGIDPTGDFYAFGSKEKLGSFPPLSTLRTAMRVGVTDEGLWLGFDCHQEEMEKVRPEIRARDSVDLWREASIELYFTTGWRELTFRKFTINALGTRADLMFEGGVYRHGWNDNGWRVRTRRHDDRWTAELFFPWSSLGGRVEPGGIVNLGVTRFSWTTGGLVGAGWGAGMSNPYIHRAGHLLIADRLTTPLKRIGRMQKRWRGPTWHTWQGEYLITVTTGKEAVERSIEQVGSVLQEVRLELAELSGDKKHVEMQKKLDELLSVRDRLRSRAPSRESWREAKLLLERARMLKAKLRIALLVMSR